MTLSNKVSFSTRLMLEVIGIIVIVFLSVSAFQRDGAPATTTFVVDPLPPPPRPLVMKEPVCPPCLETPQRLQHVALDRTVAAVENPPAPPPSAPIVVAHTELTSESDPNDAFPEFRIPFDTLQCKQIYLDCGSNQGYQLKKLYDGEKPGSPWARKFQAYFGRDVSKRQREVCAFAWEPDRLHVENHTKLRESWAARGIRAVSFPAALDDNNDLVKFYSVRNDQHKNWGSTLLGSEAAVHFAAKDVTAYEVRKFNLRSFLKHKIPNDATVLMKMDIEGTEHTLYPRLYFDGVLCKVSFLGMEVHHPYLKDKQSLLTRDPRSGGLSFERQMNLLKSVFGPSCKVVIADFDDET